MENKTTTALRVRFNTIEAELLRLEAIEDTAKEVLESAADAFALLFDLKREGKLPVERQEEYETLKVRIPELRDELEEAAQAADAVWGDREFARRALETAQAEEAAKARREAAKAEAQKIADEAKKAEEAAKAAEEAAKAAEEARKAAMDARVEAGKVIMAAKAENVAKKLAALSAKKAKKAYSQPSRKAKAHEAKVYSEAEIEAARTWAVKKAEDAARRSTDKAAEAAKKAAEAAVARLNQVVITANDAEQATKAVKTARKDEATAKAKAVTTARNWVKKAQNELKTARHELDRVQAILASAEKADFDPSRSRRIQRLEKAIEKANSEWYELWKSYKRGLEFGSTAIEVLKLRADRAAEKVKELKHLLWLETDGRLRTQKEAVRLAEEAVAEAKAKVRSCEKGYAEAVAEVEMASAMVAEDEASGRIVFAPVNLDEVRRLIDLQVSDSRWWTEAGAHNSALSTRDELKARATATTRQKVAEAQAVLQGRTTAFLPGVELPGNTEALKDFVDLMKICKDLWVHCGKRELTLLRRLSIELKKQATLVSSWGELFPESLGIEAVAQIVKAAEEILRAYKGLSGKAEDVAKLMYNINFVTTTAELPEVKTFVGYPVTGKSFRISAKKFCSPRYAGEVMSMIIDHPSEMALVMADFVAGHTIMVDEELGNVKVGFYKTNLNDIGRNVFVGYAKTVLDDMSEKDREAAAEDFGRWNKFLAGEFQPEESDDSSTKNWKFWLSGFLPEVKKALETIQMNFMTPEEHEALFGRGRDAEHLEFSDELEAQREAEAKADLNTPTDYGYVGGHYVGFEYSDAVAMKMAKSRSDIEYARNYFWDLIACFKAWPRFQKTLGFVAKELHATMDAILNAIELGNPDLGMAIADMARFYDRNMDANGFIHALEVVQATGRLEGMDDIGYASASGWLRAVLKGIQRTHTSTMDGVVAGNLEAGMADWAIWSPKYDKGLTSQWAWRLVTGYMIGDTEWVKDPTSDVDDDAGNKIAVHEVCTGHSRRFVESLLPEGFDYEGAVSEYIINDFGVDGDAPEANLLRKVVKESYAVFNLDTAVEYIMNFQDGERLPRKIYDGLFRTVESSMDLTGLDKIYAKILETRPAGGEAMKQLVSAYYAEDRALQKALEGEDATEILVRRRALLKDYKEFVAKAKAETPATGIKALAELLTRDLPTDIYSKVSESESAAQMLESSVAEDEIW